MTLSDAIEAEAEAQAVCMETAEFREGYEAFRARRPPRFP
jgi:enoyl-CoA hydratase/carnithine racemase